MVISFEPKKENDTNHFMPEKEFENLLIDQQIRIETEKQFGHIRNLIMKKAFAPVTEKQ
jgi:His-Xaa-Ser system protein HxsD